jgi:tight adherence protein B
VAAASTARLGGDVPAALAVDGSAVPQVLRPLAACFEVCSTTGSGLAAGVDRLEEGLRAAEAHRRAVDAELAGPRATAGLLAVLPVAGIGLASALGADPLHVLLHTPFGTACLVVGLILDGLGVVWTRRLVARAVGRA